MRKFIVGAYWGGLLAVAFGLLPVIVFRPYILAELPVEAVQHLTPVVVLAGFALLTSVLAAGTMVILREIAAIRLAIERTGAMPPGLPARLTIWTGKASGAVARTGKPTVACSACGRTNWREAFVCVECAAPMACDGPAPAH